MLVGYSSRRRIYAVIIAIIIVVAVISVVAWYWLTRPVLPEEIKIGVHGPLTGPSALFGSYIKEGALLAVKEVNDKGGVLGRKVVVVLGDDESKTEVGVSVFEKFIAEDKVNALFGGVHSSIAVAVMEVAAKYGIPYVMSDPTMTGIGEKIAADPGKYWCIFKLPGASYYYGKGPSEFIDYLVKTGKWKPKNFKWGCVGDDSDYGREASASFKRFLEPLGWECVGVELVKSGTADYYPILTKFKAADISLLMQSGASVPGSIALLKQFHELEMHALFFMQYIPSLPQFPELAGEFADYMIYTLLYDIFPKLVDKYNPGFLERYEMEYGHKPALTGASAYVGMLKLLKSIERAGSIDPHAICDQLLISQDFGPSGRYVFDPKTHEGVLGKDGLTQGTVQWIGGKKYFVYPPEVAEREFVVQPWAE